MSVPHFDHHFIIPSPDVTDGRRRLLLVLSDDGWAVPRWVHSARHGRTARELDDPFWPLAIQRRLRKDLGIDVSVLHADLHDERDPATDDRRTVIVLENLSPDWSPSTAARWAARDDLNSLTLARQTPRSALLAWFDEASTEPVARSTPARRPPWQQPGWIGSALGWAFEQLARRGDDVTGSPEQLGTKTGRYLMRVPTRSGAAYFKAVPEMYAREAKLISLLSVEFQANVPGLLAVDAGRRWQLTADHGGISLIDTDEIRSWERALHGFAQLQIAYVGRADAIRAAGCTDLRLDHIISEIEPLIADSAALLVGQAGGLTVNERAALDQLVPGIRLACHRLAAYAVPASLVHGDLLPANIAVVNNTPVFVDWCESTLSHPFFSVVRFLISARRHGIVVADDPGLWARLRDAYLQQWTRYAPMTSLVEAFELAHTLQPLHHALTYWHLGRLHTAAGQVVADWERRGLVALSLRRLLSQRTQLSHSLP